MKVEIIKRLLMKNGRPKYYVRCDDKEYTCSFGNPCCSNGRYVVVTGFTSPTSEHHEDITNTPLGVEIYNKCASYEWENYTQVLLDANIQITGVFHLADMKGMCTKFWVKHIGKEHNREYTCVIGTILTYPQVLTGYTTPDSTGHENISETPLGKKIIEVCKKYSKG